ncbi:hypothetical protein B0H21DRAFT_844257 [Amylocystis lapponica]|nr:hypothetical protein B0H21DRAFT_844257 [Amylocystis lapponica]
MQYLCKSCNRSFKTPAGLLLHCNRTHRHKKPKPPKSTFRFHPHLNARPCDIDGNFLPAGTPPPEDDSLPDWEPFNDRPSFEFAELVFKKIQLSGGDLDHLLEVWAAHNVLTNGGDPIFASTEAMHSIIDLIRHGDAPWESFTVRYNGPVTPDSPSWKHAEYVIHCRNVQTVAHNMLANKDFDNHFDYIPFQEYVAPSVSRYSNIMSGQWAYKQATKIASDKSTHGAMLVPIILGADKTTVSVATGQNEFHPVYMSLANPHNSVRRAHRDAITPVAFLSIPKTNRDGEDTPEFRVFRKQLYHASLAKIMAPLRSAMTTPEVVQCPDGHFCRAVYELGPFIADYPEQVVLAGIVQGWCPKCLVPPERLKEAGQLRCREHSEFFREHFDDETMWTAWGIDASVVPFTDHFPHADIHELITPDLLHQLIKGMFKDHLVTWVEQYLHTVHSKADALRIMDDIDRQIAAVPAFPGLHRFPEGRNFKQWTGNDSKALMKVYLPAIEGHVPDDMVHCFAAYLDFCYLARRSAHDTPTLVAMQEALDRFHQYRIIFETVGIRTDGFSLPRQHALEHYIKNIRLFGSPNGICSSITESKHIRAVKEPWRRSSKNNPLLQILLTNQRLDKLAAARAYFTSYGMLRGSVLAYALQIQPIQEDDTFLAQESRDEEDEVADAAAYTRSMAILSDELSQPNLEELIRQFLYDQIFATNDTSSGDIHISECPVFSGRLSVYRSASATFYAPSELSGNGRMHREIIRSNPTWRNEYERFDTVLVDVDSALPGMRGMAVVRIMSLLTLTHETVRYPCALVEWFVGDGELPDPVTGMYVVKPEFEDGQRVMSFIHLDCIVRAVHLIGVYRDTPAIPVDFHFSYSLDAFNMFYVNQYTDYHSHECIF